MAYIATQGKKKKLNSSNDKYHCLYVLYQNELITLLTDTTLYIKCRCCRFGSILVIVSTVHTTHLLAM